MSYSRGLGDTDWFAQSTAAQPSGTSITGAIGAFINKLANPTVSASAPVARQGLPLLSLAIGAGVLYFVLRRK